MNVELRRLAAFNRGPCAKLYGTEYGSGNTGIRRKLNRKSMFVAQVHFFAKICRFVVSDETDASIRPRVGSKRMFDL